MITVTDKQIDSVLRKITSKNGKSHVLNLPDGTIIYGKLSRKEKKQAIKQAKKNAKKLVDDLSHEINKHIIERLKRRTSRILEKIIKMICNNG